MAVVSIWTFIDPHTAACGKAFDDMGRCDCAGTIRPEAYRLSILLGAHSGLGLKIVWSEWVESPVRVSTLMRNHPGVIASLGGNP